MIIFGHMCTLIDPNDIDFKEYRVYFKDLLCIAEVKKTGPVYDRILEAATKLLKREITIQMKNEVGEARILKTYLVTGVERALKENRTENGYIVLNFHPKLKPYLLELKRDFTKFDIRNYKFLHSGTITRLYQLLKSYYDRRRRDPQFELDELKQMLGVAKKYNLYANFRIKVLDEAQRKLAAGTDIKFRYEEVKNRNRVAGILFHIAVNEGGEFVKWGKTASDTEGGTAHVRETFKVSLTSDTTLDTPETIENEAIIVEKFGVSKKMYQDLIKKYSEADIERAIRITEKAIIAQKITGKTAGFFVEAVRRAYTDEAQDKLDKKQKGDPSVKTGQNSQNSVGVTQSHTDTKNETKKAAFEREKTATLAVLASDEVLRETVKHRLNSGLLFNSYDLTKSFDENLQNPLLLAAAMNTVKEYIK